MQWDRSNRTIGTTGSRQIARVGLGFAAILGAASTALLFSGKSLAETDPYVVQATYEFRIIKGQRLDVCQAYLNRLRKTQFDEPPFCDIPENDSIEGFTLLKREPIPVEEAAALWPHIFTFSRGSIELPPQEQWRIDEKHLFEQGSERTKQNFGRNILAWKYDPRVSLNNDGKVENLLIWQGYGVAGWGYFGKCGWDYFEGSGPGGGRQTRIGVVLKDDDSGIDVQATKRLLEWPTPEGPPDGKEREGVEERFRTLGYSLGLFEYRGKFYMDTFYHRNVGDLQGKRKNDPSWTTPLGCCSASTETFARCVRFR